MKKEYCEKAELCKNYQPYVCDELCRYEPGSSWLNGKYDIGCWNVTVDGAHSFVNFEAKEEQPVSSFTFQGNEADDTIQQIHDIWVKSEALTQQDAIEAWANMYLY